MNYKECGLLLNYQGIYLSKVQSSYSHIHDYATAKLMAPSKKRGRPALHEQHPGLVPCIASYISQNSAEAHLRRRDSIMYTNGVSLKDIVSHIKSTLGLNVSKSAVHYLMRPRRKKTTSSKRHKSLVDARVPPKRNTGEKKIHEDFHFSCSQVNLVNELAQLCNENTISLSVDNKNKVDVGIPATSRRAQIRRYHIENEAPIYNDHDFPYPNSKLTPAGYQQQERQPFRIYLPVKTSYVSHLTIYI
ncbi:uncharacterized protein LOC130630278 isoform X2 [Hydractinia symbiolongicarpus]|uniref:uncharacterized protein LOC130630278 isoform X2 n=1 Tax=Hydractinia symbiolongicarpus TaxID=13093 RepID=UPI00254FD5E5|nr:uncharacterized protein LOC130630278 isoform X2 [Hydractinia symbiolongicarpus]